MGSAESGRELERPARSGEKLLCCTSLVRRRHAVSHATGLGPSAGRTRGGRCTSGTASYVRSTGCPWWRSNGTAREGPACCVASGSVSTACSAERLEQTLRHTRPRPVLLDRAAARLREPGGARRAAARAAPRSFRREVVRVAGREADLQRGGGAAAGTRPRAPRRSPRGPECRATRGGVPAAADSAATMPNASGKTEGTTVTSAERDQMHEVPVVERAGEESAGRRDPLELAR